MLKIKDKIKIGSVVSEIDDVSKELFFVIGFQPDIDGKENFIALMDRNFRTFISPIDNLLLDRLATIDDVFPSKVKAELFKTGNSRKETRV
jgi:hypothetical protein